MALPCTNFALAIEGKGKGGNNNGGDNDNDNNNGDGDDGGTTAKWITDTCFYAASYLGASPCGALSPPIYPRRLRLGGFRS